MGSVGTSSKTHYEPVNKGLIFGIAKISPEYISIDGYSNKSTVKGMLGDLAKAVDQYSKTEGDAIRSSIKDNEMEQIPGSSGSDYILEWESVPSASRHVDADGVDTLLSSRNDTYENFTTEYKDGKWYVHIRFVR